MLIPSVLGGSNLWDQGESQIGEPVDLLTFVTFS